MSYTHSLGKQLEFAARLGLAPVGTMKVSEMDNDHLLVFATSEESDKYMAADLDYYDSYHFEEATRSCFYPTYKPLKK